MGVWDIDELETVCSYALLNEWMNYLIFIAKVKNGEIEEEPIKVDDETLFMAIAANFGAKIIDNRKKK